MAEAKDGQTGQFKRFSGESLDGRELRKWKLWAQAKMAATKDLDRKQRGPWVFTLLDGLALETCEHLSLTQLMEEGGDEHIWKLLEERFPDRLQHDLLAECLKEVFNLAAKDGETMPAWTSRVQESFSKCRRKVSVDFPTEARGWVCLNASGLSPDQRAIVTAKAGGDLKFETITASMRSCFPDFVAGGRAKKAMGAMVASADEVVFDTDEVDIPDEQAFHDVEALLADHGIRENDISGGDTFEESEVVEILAATWKEKRTEIAKLQKSRNFRQANFVKKQFSQDYSDVRKRTKCWRCNQLGHFSRECSKPKGEGKGSKSQPSSSGAAAVCHEALLVSSPGFGVIDSGCGKTLIGQETLGALMRKLHEKGLPAPKLRKEQNLFTFGNAAEEVADTVATIPVGINGCNGKIDAAVIKGPAPLLLSRSTMKSLGAELSFTNDSLSLRGGEARPLSTNASGQYIINIMEFDTTEVLSVESEDMTNPEPDQQGTITRREARCLKAFEPAWSKNTDSCIVAELFSPPRFSVEAERWGKSGLSFDIKQGWDLLSPSTQKHVDEILDEAKPDLLVLCPECKHWGGWYRMNQYKLPMWRRLANKRIAEKQVLFCIQQAKKQIKRGGRVLFEHPWSSNMWKFPPMKKLLNSMHLCKASMCAYGLVSPEGIPIQKNTGLAVSHADMCHLAQTCPGHESHQTIAGRCEDGELLSAKTAEYTSEFCRTWLGCVYNPCHLCHFHCLQEEDDMGNPIGSAVECLAAQDDKPDPESLKATLRKLHNNLGHPSNRDLVRVLKNAGGTPAAIRAAEQFTCEICIQRQRPTPCLPTSAHQILDFNHRVGIDVKQVPGWLPNQQVKCLNIVDWASSFQVMCPFFEVETGPLIKKLFQEKWQSWAGSPVEVLMDPARTNLSAAFLDPLELSGSRVLSTAAEAHNQLGKVEKHGHLFEVVLQKVLDQVQPTNKEEYLTCVIHTMNSKNEMINKKGLSPCQHVFGRNHRVPADLLQDNPDPVAATAPLHDPAAARSQAIRTAARIALAQSQDEVSLRTALNARPRVERDFLAGDFVSYWRTQKFQKGVRIVGGRWYGTAIVMGKVGRNFLVYHRRNLFKVSPEHLRHASLEERAVAQADGRELLGLEKFLGDKGIIQGSQYVDLTNQNSGPPGNVEVSESPSCDAADRPLPEAEAPVEAPVAAIPSSAMTTNPDMPVITPESTSQASQEPYPTRRDQEDSGNSHSYEPIRRRHTTKKSDPEMLYRPPQLLPQDFMEACQELHGSKRQASREPSTEPPTKSQRGEGDEALMIEVLTDLQKHGESIEVFMANFLKKKMQHELHHSNNPPEIQEKIDVAKAEEWRTLGQEKQCLAVIPPHEAKKIRQQRPDRIMSSRFVITEKHEDDTTRMKARWCLRGHHDPDLVTKVLSGKCHSPTLSQLGRNMLLQILVSKQWTMKLGDIKGAFLEANVRDQALANPVFAELPPGGVPGVAPGSVVQILGNIYGANDAPHNWYKEFDATALDVGFVRSKFDACLYYCHDKQGNLQGIMGAHVDDTITGGEGEQYNQAIKALRQRFPFRKWREGQGEFLGVFYEQDPSTFEITYQQKDYAQNIHPIKLSKDRSREVWKPASPQEISALRAVNGALGWLSSQTRPDLAVQTSISQQCFPNPTVQDLVQANQAVRRAKQHSNMVLRVPYIDPQKLTVCFWSDAAFADANDLKTQGGWLVGMTSTDFHQGADCPLSCVGWKSYKLPRVVASTLAGEAQSFASASGIAEWCMLLLAEALDGPFQLSQVEEVLRRRDHVGITDCKSLYDHLISLGSGGVLDDKRIAIDIAVIRQSVQRSRLTPRWVPTDRMVADGLTKDKGEPLDLLRSVLRVARYQLADEQTVLDRKREEKELRKNLGKSRQVASDHHRKDDQSPDNGDSSNMS